MEQKNIQLNEQDFQQYKQIDDSIKHWSIEHTKAVLQAKRLESAVEGMYQGRMQLIHGVLNQIGVNPAHVHQVNVNTDNGEMIVSFNEVEPNPAADPSEV